MEMREPTAGVNTNAARRDFAGEWGRNNNRTSSVPEFSNQIVYSVPGHSAVSYSAPPPHEVRWEEIRMCMKVVGYGYLAIAEWGRNETYSERVVVERHGI